MAALDNYLQTVSVEQVPCPGCAADRYERVATGPDYDGHCCRDQPFNLVVCLDCGLYYLNPRPTPDMLGLIYAADEYVCYDFAEKGNPIVAWLRKKRDRLKLKPVMGYMDARVEDLRVLDIGAGDGTLLRLFQSMGVPASNLYGLDINRGAVEGLRSLGFQGLLGRAEEMDLNEEPFDLITMNHVIEHVADPGKVLASAREALRPGGLLWLETPNIAGWDRRFFARGTWGGYHFPRHWTLWSPPLIGKALEEVGFHVLALNTVAATFVWTWSINHALQKRKWPEPMTRFFSLNNPLVMGFFWFFDLLPASLGRSSNMRIVARSRDL